MLFLNPLALKVTIDKNVSNKEQNNKNKEESKNKVY